MLVCSDKVYCYSGESDNESNGSDSDSSSEDKRKIKKARLDSTAAASPVPSPNMPNMPSPGMPSIGWGFVSENKTTPQANPSHSVTSLEERDIMRSFAKLSTTSGSINPAPLVEAGPPIINPTGTEV